MPFYTTYSASLTQTGTGPITASVDAKNNNYLIGTWNRYSPGKYAFRLSGSNQTGSGFTPVMVSGSITGGLALNFSYIPRNQSDTGSNFILFTSSSNLAGTESIQLHLHTYFIASRSFADNCILGDFDLKIGIISGSLL